MPWNTTLIKLGVISVVIAGAYIWHVQDVNHKVEQARTNERNALVIQYSKQAIKLQDNAYLAEVELKDKIKRITDDKNKELSSVNTKYINLLNWLSAQSSDSSTGKQTSVSNGTINPEGTGGINQQGLLQGDAVSTWEFNKSAIELIGFAKQTEELKVYLLSCYKQYDQVLEDQQRFRVDNTPRKP